MKINADVVVFGGGVTGLTVAHELAERNFRVAVIEPDYRPSPESHVPDDEEENPGLGGVARSQWGYFANNAKARDPVQTPGQVAKMANAPPMFPGVQSFTITYSKTPDGAVQFGSLLDPLLPDAQAPAALDNLLRPLVVAMAEHGTWELTCDVFSFDLLDGKDDREPLIAALLDRMVGVSPSPEYAQQISKWRSRVTANIGLADDDVATFRVALNLFRFPGEHGFRFFPSFYRHIFDQMRRTPASMVDPATGRSTRRGRDTVFDNLVSSDVVAYVGNAAGPMARMSRKPPRSQGEVEALLRDLKREAGYTSRDLSMLSTKVWKYLTSCRARREREYERMSWYDFVEGDRFSDRGCFLVQTSPGTLVGLLGSDGDARTQGTTLLQLLSDQTNEAGGRDMLLNGPTDTAWLGHWYRYLKTLKVDFYRGTLNGFKLDLTATEIVPDVGVAREPNGEPTEPAEFDPIEGTPGGKVFFVLALPLLQAHRCAEQYLQTTGALLGGATPVPRDFLTLRDFPRTTNAEWRERMKTPYPKGPLRHLSGIQYFFNHDVRLWRAHIHYLDAPAGLTAIAQPQFWYEPGNALSGFRSILSVDIGIWERPSLRRPRPPSAGVEWYPWSKNRQEIAEQIWRQIESGHRGDFPSTWPRLPTPAAFMLDRGLIFDDKTGLLCDDATPFVVNETGRYRSRPGATVTPTHRVEIAYDVAPGRYVLAGGYMQTYTRITSMESACESGRHAVNAILRHLNIAGEPCSTWDPEDFEPSELASLRQLDETLVARGLPHMVDILGPMPVDAGMLQEGWASFIESVTKRR